MMQGRQASLKKDSGAIGSQASMVSPQTTSAAKPAPGNNKLQGNANAASNAMQGQLQQQQPSQYQSPGQAKQQMNTPGMQRPDTTSGQRRPTDKMGGAQQFQQNIGGGPRAGSSGLPNQRSDAFSPPYYDAQQRRSQFGRLDSQSLRGGTFNNPNHPGQDRINNGIRSLCDYIKRFAGQVPSVLHFFQPYDCYEGRIFGIWELMIIFEEKINEQVFWDLAEENQMNEKMMAGTISLKWLANEIELSRHLGNPRKMVPQKNSIYESRWTDATSNSKKLGILMQELAQQRDFNYNPQTGYEKYFGDHNYDLSTQDTDRAFRKFSDEVDSDPTTIQEFVDFVRTRDTHNFTINKVMFVNAVRFLLNKYDPKAAAKAECVIPNVTPAKGSKTTASATTSNIAPKAAPKITIGGANKVETNPASKNKLSPPPRLGQLGKAKNLDDLLMGSDAGGEGGSDTDSTMNLTRNTGNIGGKPKVEVGGFGGLSLRKNVNAFPDSDAQSQGSANSNAAAGAFKSSSPPNKGLATKVNINLGGKTLAKREPVNVTRGKIVEPKSKTTTAATAAKTTLGVTSTTKALAPKASIIEADISIVELINKIVTHCAVKMVQLNQLFSCPATRVDGKMCYKQEEFLEVLERSLNFTKNDALKLSQQFIVQVQKDPNVYVDSRKFEDFIHQQQDKFKQIQGSHGAELDKILQSLRDRHTGAYKYFLNYADPENKITKAQWTKSIDNLGFKTWTNLQKNGIFDKLDFQKKLAVYLLDVEAMLKEHARKKEKIKPDRVLEAILAAFNVDEIYIETELNKRAQLNQNVLYLDAFVSFFGEFPSHPTYYQLADITALGEIFVSSKDEVDLKAFTQRLTETRRNKNMQRGVKFQGIHRTLYSDPALVSKAQFTPIHSFSQFSQDCTKAAQSITMVQKPLNWSPSVRDEMIQDIQKACFVRGKMVEDYFGTFLDQTGNILLFNLISAIKNLGLQYQWSNFDQEVQHLHGEIDKAFNHGRMMGSIRPTDIDQFVHHLAKDTLQGMHQELVYNIQQKIAMTKGMSVPIEQAFKQISSATLATCTRDQLAQVLSQYYQPSLSRTNIEFLASQYIRTGNTEQVHFKPFLDDLNHVQHQFESGSAGFLNKKLSAGINTQQAAGQDKIQTVCEHVIKKLYIFQLDIMTAFTQWSPNMFMTEQDFMRIFGENLQLVPEFASAQDLQVVFQQIQRGSHGQGRVMNQEVMNFIQRNCPKTHTQIKQELIDATALKVSDVQAVFDRDQFYLTGNGMVTFGHFSELLQQNLYMSRLNADFLAAIYQKQGYVNCRVFLQDYHAATLSQQPQLDQFGRPLPPSQPSYQQPYPGGPVGSHHDNQFDLEQQARDVLLKISQIVQQQNLQLNKVFGHFQKDITGKYISKTDFTRTLGSYMRELSFAETNILEQKYGNPRNIDQVDLMQFQSDLAQIRVQSGPTTLAQPSEKNKQSLSSLEKAFSTGKVSITFVINLKKRDAYNTGYLNKFTILEAINETFNQRQGNRKSIQMTMRQLDAMIAIVNSNNRGDYSYKEFMQHIFGIEKGEQLFFLDLPILEQEAIREQAGGSRQTIADKRTFQLPLQVQNPSDARMGNIGKKIIEKRINYEAVVMSKIGPNSADTNLTERELNEILKEIQIQLTTDERLAHETWFRQNRNSNQGKVSAILWLQALGIPNQTISLPKEKTGAKNLKILSAEESARSQQLITAISRELQAGGIRAQSKIEKYRTTRTQTGLSAQEFRTILQKEISPQLSKKISDQDILNLVNYLVREEHNMVSFEKLYEALELTERDVPLRQEKVDEYRKYMDKVSADLSQGIPPVIIHFNHFLENNNTNIRTIFELNQPHQLRGTIPVKMFEESLEKAGYIPKDRNALIDAIDETNQRKLISVPKLTDYLNQLRKPADAKDVRGMYGRFEPTVRAKIAKISQYMKQNNITVAQMHQILDKDGNGYVDRMEFVSGMESMNIAGLMKRDYNTIFEHIDLDGNGFLSVNEFGLFLEGASLTREQRISNIPQNIMQEVKQEIQELFDMFDADGSGGIDAQEILTAMKGLGHPITLEQAQQMIASVDTRGRGEIDRREFEDLFMPIMMDKLLQTEDSMEATRAMFKEADVNYSGFLTADQVYGVLLKQGVDLSFEELVELMEEFDMDGDAQLDIDEFCTMMNLGDDVNFQAAGSKNTYLKIRKARRLNVMDFIKAFSSMPASFVPSSFTEKWAAKKHLPSSTMKPQIDPRTMMWKDMYPAHVDQLPKEQQKPDFRPEFRPIESLHGVEIVLEGTAGIILPDNSPSFNRNDVVKRAIRVGVFDQRKKDYIGNTWQIPANWDSKKPDEWHFNTRKEIGLNPLLLRISTEEEIQEEDIDVFFELVIYIRSGPDRKVTEMSCGWASSNLKELKRDVSKRKIEVKGGSPTTQIAINERDVKNVSKRSGIAGLFGNSASQSSLLISTKQAKALEEDTKIHMTMLPSICLVSKRILHFVTGFRNYAARILLKESLLAAGEFKQPAGNIAISCFPKIIDCPDILESFVICWNEDIVNLWNMAEKKKFALCSQRAEDYIQKIYPILFSNEFDLTSNETTSACGEASKLARRKELVISALRFDSQKKRAVAPKQSIAEMTTFKPFNVREIQFDVFDQSQTSHMVSDQIMLKYESAGFLDKNRSARNPAVPFGSNREHPGRPNSQLAPNSRNTAFSQRTPGHSNQQSYGGISSSVQSLPPYQGYEQNQNVPYDPYGLTTNVGSPQQPQYPAHNRVQSQQEPQSQFARQSGSPPMPIKINVSAPGGGHNPNQNIRNPNLLPR